MSIPLKCKAKIISRGLVQGVGFRYFVFKQASKFNLFGYSKNLYNGDVETLVEGYRIDIDKLFQALKQGPSRAAVSDCSIEYLPYEGDLTGFDVI
jgi:acylphosphatase